MTAMKKTEDGDGLLVRFYEWAGKGGNVTLTLPPGIRLSELGQLDGEAGGVAAASRRGAKGHCAGYTF